LYSLKELATALLVLRKHQLLVEVKPKLKIQNGVFRRNFSSYIFIFRGKLAIVLRSNRYPAQVIALSN